MSPCLTRIKGKVKQSPELSSALRYTFAIEKEPSGHSRLRSSTYIDLFYD